MRNEPEGLGCPSRNRAHLTPFTKSTLAVVQGVCHGFHPFEISIGKAKNASYCSPFGLWSRCISPPPPSRGPGGGRTCHLTG